MQIDQLKTAFAAELLKNPKDPFKVALTVFGDNPEVTGQALRAAVEWPKDPFVIAEQSRLLEENGEGSYLPSKADLARDVWEKAQGCRNADDYQKLMRLYAEVRGFIEKPTTQINNNVNNVTNKVMVVREHGSDSDWETRLREQQRALTNASAVCH